jgi:NADH oxidase (H2O2-forming)
MKAENPKFTYIRRVIEFCLRGLKKMNPRILIIGGGAAGQSAAAAARKANRQVEIIMITREKYPTYSRCGLPYVLGREISTFENLILFPKDYYKSMRIDIRLETEVTELDAKNKTATLKDYHNKVEKIQYDSVVLATGASSFIPPMKGSNLKGIYAIRTIDDGKAIENVLSPGKNAIIIGGGITAVEMADALALRGLKVTILYRKQHLLRMMFDQDIAEMIQQGLLDQGVVIKFDKSPDEIRGEKEVKSIVAGGEEIPADIVIMTTGFRTNTQLAVPNGIEIGHSGGFKVDSRAKTNLDGVYAAGDCTECLNLITGESFLPQLGTVAARQGTAAGINAAGGEAHYPGALGAGVSKITKVEFGSTGLTQSQAEEAKIQTIAASIRWRTIAEYYPGWKEIKVKLVADKVTGRLLGGQIAAEGGGRVASMVDMVTTAIQSRMTVKDFSVIDTCYSPPVADVWNPLILAADNLIRRMK